MTRPPPPDYKTPMMPGAGSAGTAMGQPHMAGQQQQQPQQTQQTQQQTPQGYPGAPSAVAGATGIRPGIRAPLNPGVTVGRPSPNGATSPMQTTQQQQQPRPMMNPAYQQQQQQQTPQGMMGMNRFSFFFLLFKRSFSLNLKA